jgi:hypothetical protein
VVQGCSTEASTKRRWAGDRGQGSWQFVKVFLELQARSIKLHPNEHCPLQHCSIICLFDAFLKNLTVLVHILRTGGPHVFSTGDHAYIFTY